MHKLYIQLEQINFIIGDLDGNYQKISSAYQRAQKNNVDLVMFSELALTGYPPEDLLLKPYFIGKTEEKIKALCAITKDQKTAILVGAPAAFSDKHGNKALYNAAFLIENGEINSIIRKTTLPNYGVFDEKRYFTPAPTLSTINFRGFWLAILICEDIWNAQNAFLLADKNVDAILSINASPFVTDKAQRRLKAAQEFIKNIRKPLIYINQIGGQDSLIFDGSSFATDGAGEICLYMDEFCEDSKIVNLEKNDGETSIAISANHQIKSDKIARIYNAIILGIRDYIYKNGFEKIVIGMSGGIDSALAATLAVDAIGSQNIKLVALPTKYNSKESLQDALACCENLNVKLDVIEIENVFETMLEALSQQFENTSKNVAEENIQSRIRGNILMALSNKFGHLLLTTGNKSEMATGYATIYGDMCGSFNPLKDIYKTEIYELVNWRNENIPAISVYKKNNLIPKNIITKAPTAELRDNQKDSDSLPEYEILDAILFHLIEEEKSVEEIIALGFEEKIVKKVSKLFYSSEYKRRQAVIGPKVSLMSFDKDRRYPITNKFNH